MLDSDKIWADTHALGVFLALSMSLHLLPSPEAEAKALRFAEVFGSDVDMSPSQTGLPALGPFNWSRNTGFSLLDIAFLHAQDVANVMWTGSIHVSAEPTALWSG